jgi:hypothetical protein
MPCPRQDIDKVSFMSRDLNQRNLSKTLNPKPKHSFLTLFFKGYGKFKSK